MTKKIIKAVKKAIARKPVSKPKAEEAAAFVPCETCSQTGLLSEKELCPACSGTGKVYA